VPDCIWDGRDARRFCPACGRDKVFALSIGGLAWVLAAYEVAEERGGVGVDALADAVDVVALQQAVDALLGGVGITAVEPGGELCDLELLAVEGGGDSERQLVCAGGVEVAVLEELGVESVLNAYARARVQLGGDGVQVGGVGGVPERLAVLLDEVRVAVDVGGDLLGDGGLDGIPVSAAGFINASAAGLGLS
jgi:hypothetical protein